MGFWGTFVVHRGPRPLAELFPALEALRTAELCDAHAVGDWSVTRVADTAGELPEEFVALLRDATAAPALTARVLDSSAAYVSAAGVATPSWQAWLHLEIALGYLLETPAPFDAEGNYLGPDWVDPEYVDPQYQAERAALARRLRAEAPGGVAGAGAAVAWARESGLEAASAEEVAAVLESVGVVAEETLFAVLERLGVITAKE